MLYIFTVILATKKHKRIIIIITEYLMCEILNIVSDVSTYSSFMICWIHFIPLHGSIKNNAKLLLEGNTFCNEFEASLDLNLGY